MKNSIAKGSWVVAGAALLLLVLHTARVPAIRVDNTSVLLLIIAIACLLAPWLTKIRFGEFEAEIGPKEVERLKETVEKHIPEMDVKSVPIAGPHRSSPSNFNPRCYRSCTCSGKTKNRIGEGAIGAIRSYRNT